MDYILELNAHLDLDDIYCKAAKERFNFNEAFCNEIFAKKTEFGFGCFHQLLFYYPLHKLLQICRERKDHCIGLITRYITHGLQIT